MNTNELNTALYEKMAAEQDTFRNWLKGQPPEEILNHAYEYTVREDIVMEMEELDLTDAQAKALLDSPSPLADVYRYFDKLETGHMDLIRDSIENQAEHLSAQKEEHLMEKAKDLIASFCQAEYGSDPDFSNLAEVGIAYTTLEDDEIPIQVNVDLERHRIDRLLDWKPLESWQYDSLESLVNDALENLDFDDLTYVSEQELSAVWQAEPENTEIVPFYPHSADYASEHGEADQYRASLQTNFTCIKAIEQAIATHYSNNRLNTEAAVNAVLEKFGPERVQFVLANTVRKKAHDGRISRDNKAWAETVPMPEGSDPAGRHAYLVVDQVNPGLTDLFLKQVRKSLKEPEKSSVLGKLKQEPPERKVAPSKKREPER